ncbi:glutamate synthase (NADPH), homotetrameric [Candidatus Bathyarchaeota archaeon RBG_13_60_20]|nr:MAG: glutamate synthase (NADPH), homotetrameric [Candidatus Bathyarchaeota archaeon RBG_13_60_20]
MASGAPQVDMPKQAPEERKSNFDEVALGYSEEQALAEASRCLGCKNPRCVKGCPVGVDIPGFIGLVKERRYVEAARRIKETNSLPAVCGRVCPQESQCQMSCVLGVKGQPVAIGRLERYAADYERSSGAQGPARTTRGGGRVAVVGSGPSGLTVAAELQKKGHQADVYESLHAAGGVLMYGIPEFRLPKDIVQAEIEYVKGLGVNLHLDSTVGRLLTVGELLRAGYDAVFIGSGAGLPHFLRVPGENLKGVYSANEFLIRTNLMKAYRFPEYRTPITVGRSVAVIGGGNVAMDSARCALRLGGEKVYIVYRRGKGELPARLEEAENAEEEGVEFMYQTNPVRFIGDDRGYVTRMECVRMELGEPDASGRRSPSPIKGSEFLLDVDTVIVAIGQSPNPIIQQTTDGLEATRWGTIVVDEETMATSISGVYAGGDVVSGAATVISAMGAGKAAAASIHNYIEKRGQSAT